MKKNFDHLVTEQMQTMERLLTLQNELEQFGQMDHELEGLESEEEIAKVQAELDLLKHQLKEVHAIFQTQTEEVIRHYQEMKSMA